MKRVASAVGAAIASLALLAIAALAFGHSPRELLGILVTGSVGSSFALFRRLARPRGAGPP